MGLEVELVRLKSPLQAKACKNTTAAGVRQGAGSSLGRVTSFEKGETGLSLGVCCLLEGSCAYLPRLMARRKRENAGLLGGMP